jgi:hypothetical protein
MSKDQRSFEWALTDEEPSEGCTAPLSEEDRALRLWEDFCTFSRWQLATYDLDPVYPVLRAAFQGMSHEIQVWRLLLFVTFYHLGSAERWWTQEPEPSLEAVNRIEASTTGVERRGMRGNTPLVRAFLTDALRLKEVRVACSETVRPGETGWNHLRKTILTCQGAGPWTSYKWADLCKNVLGLPVTAPDIGVGGGGLTAGPVPGLARLTGQSLAVCASDVMLQRQAYHRALTLGVPFNGLDEFETALCDFNSLCKGHYYVGHDIDAMMAQLAPESALWAARAAAIPDACLGERHGWTGVRKALKRAYTRTGHVYCDLTQRLQGVK